MCEPEGNGVAERFIRTLKERLLWVQRFETVAELARGLQCSSSATTSNGWYPSTTTVPLNRHAHCQRWSRPPDGDRYH